MSKIIAALSKLTAAVLVFALACTVVWVSAAALADDTSENQAEMMCDPSESENPAQDDGSQQDKTSTQSTVQSREEETHKTDELPAATGRGILHDVLWRELAEPAAAELASLTEEQHDKLVEIWTYNGFIIESAEQVLDTYGCLGLSNEAALFLHCSNLFAASRYVDEHYVGQNSAYLTAFDEVLDRYTLLLAENLSEYLAIDNGRGIGQLLLDCFNEAREIEYTEQDETGVPGLMNGYDSYIANQSADDAADFLVVMSQIAEKIN